MRIEIIYQTLHRFYDYVILIYNECNSMKVNEFKNLL